MTPGFVTLDRTAHRFWLRIDGFAADEILAQHCVIAELPSLRHLTFIISLGTETDIDWCNLSQSLPKDLDTGTWTRGHVERRGLVKVPPHLPLSPREAFAPREILPVEQTNRISAELVCLPTGIPVLMPGVVITPAALDYLAVTNPGNRRIYQWLC